MTLSNNIETTNYRYYHTLSIYKSVLYCVHLWKKNSFRIALNIHDSIMLISFNVNKLFLSYFMPKLEMSLLLKRNRKYIWCACSVSIYIFTGTHCDDKFIIPFDCIKSFIIPLVLGKFTSQITNSNVNFIFSLLWYIRRFKDYMLITLKFTPIIKCNRKRNICMATVCFSCWTLICFDQWNFMFNFDIINSYCYSWKRIAHCSGDVKRKIKKKKLSSPLPLRDESLYSQ